MRIKESILISVKPKLIWDYWMDVSNDIHWRNGITKAAWTSEPPYGIGSTGEHTHKDTGVMKWEVTAFHDGCSFEFVHTEGELQGSIAMFHVESEKNGSRVNVQIRISGPFIMRVMMFFMGGVMRNGVRGDLEKLKNK